ncbi:MAG: hypothetical protein HOB79_12975 [Rhodospirillaceae bacterium]|jgi:hypothetical protein|nr:hypothetical protein [Rhodospirillaceae bacterium]
MPTFGHLRRFDQIDFSSAIAKDSGPTKTTPVLVTNDAVDGSHPPASQCAKLVVFNNHKEIGAVHE